MDSTITINKCPSGEVFTVVELMGDSVDCIKPFLPKEKLQDND